jgi:hypothetical protein
VRAGLGKCGHAGHGHTVAERDVEGLEAAAAAAPRERDHAGVADAPAPLQPDPPQPAARARERHDGRVGDPRALEPRERLALGEEPVGLPGPKGEDGQVAAAASITAVAAVLGHREDANVGDAPLDATAHQLQLPQALAAPLSDCAHTHVTDQSGRWAGVAAVIAHPSPLPPLFLPDTQVVDVSAKFQRLQLAAAPAQGDQRQVGHEEAVRERQAHQHVRAREQRHKPCVLDRHSCHILLIHIILEVVVVVVSRVLVACCDPRIRQVK